MPGFTLPFQASSGSIGFFDVTTRDIDIAKTNLKSLILTNWGERVMNYFFGANLREFLFEQTTGDELKSKIADRIISQIDKWLPYIGISELNVLFSKESQDVGENSIGIRLVCFLTSKPTESFTLFVVT